MVLRWGDELFSNRYFKIVLVGDLAGKTYLLFFLSWHELGHKKVYRTNGAWINSGVNILKFVNA